MVSAMLHVEGASKITIADIESRRVDFATQNGFADKGVVVPRKRAATGTTEENLEISRELADLFTADGEFDVVFECTGVESCVQAAIYSSAPAGRVMLVGMGSAVQTLPLQAAAVREVDIVGVFRYANTYQYGIEILANKEKKNLPDITKLITQRYKGFENVPGAFATAARPIDDNGDLVIKVLIET
jgi:L-iditol 2-dehydrogenase